MASMGMIIHDGIGPALDYRVAMVGEAIHHAVEGKAAEIEAYAKSNAPWNDITGNARAGLRCDVSLEGGVIVLTLSHSVDYGVWLETIQDGAYATIMPTLEALAPSIMSVAGTQVLYPGGA